MQIDSKDGLLGLVDAEGFDSIDGEIGSWIQTGAFDTEVAARATELGWIPPWTPYSELDRPLF